MADRIYDVGPFSVRAPEDMRPVRFRLGQFVLSFDPDSEHCGRDCSCCEDEDGVAPIDHDPGCDWGNYNCGCEGILERAKDRKRVRLFIGACVHSKDPRRPM